MFVKFNVSQNDRNSINDGGGAILLHQIGSLVWLILISLPFPNVYNTYFHYDSNCNIGLKWVERTKMTMRLVSA